MSTRSILATLSFVLVAVAPSPGDLADEPGDASAEVAVTRGSAQLTVRDAWDLSPSSPFTPRPALAIALLDAPEAAVTTTVAWAVTLRPPYLPRASRPPPS